MNNSECGYFVAIVLAIVLISAASSAVYWIKKEYLGRAKAQRPATIHSDDDLSIQIWAAVYQQSAESFRDLAKLIVSVNIAGLAGTAALLGNTKWSGSFLLTAALASFAIGLVFTLLPTAGLSEQYRDDLTSILRSFKRRRYTHRVRVPHAWPTGIRYFMSLVSLSSITVGILLFTTGLAKEFSMPANIPESGQHRPALQLEERHSVQQQQPSTPAAAIEKE